MLITTLQLEAALDRAKIHTVPWLPRNGMTVGKHIFIRKSVGEPENSTLVSLRLMYHEAAHVLQYEHEGFFSFLAQYFSQYLYGLTTLHSHERAYKTISFEVQARAAASKAMNEVWEYEEE